MTIVIGVIFAAVVFLVQLLLCFKIKNKIVRYIPLYGLFIGAFITFLHYLDFFDSPSGIIIDNEIEAMFMAIVLVIALVAILLAWLVYLSKNSRL